MLGLGRADPNRLSSHTADFLKFLKSTGRISFNIPSLRGHAYLLEGTSTRTVVGDGVLLVGDAAGLAYPQSGEGIRLSGLLAAKYIAEANGTYSRQKLDAYRIHIGAKRQPWMTKMGGVLPQQWISSLARQLVRRRWFVRSVVLNQWFLPVE